VKRNVVVTQSAYGTDKRCTLEAFGSRRLDRGGIHAIRLELIQIVRL